MQFGKFKWIAYKTSNCKMMTTTKRRIYKTVTTTERRNYKPATTTNWRNNKMANLTKQRLFQILQKQKVNTKRRKFKTKSKLYILPVLFNISPPFFDGINVALFMIWPRLLTFLEDFLLKFGTFFFQLSFFFVDNGFYISVFLNVHFNFE